MRSWLRDHLANVLTVIGLIIVVYQLHQSNYHQMWSNYNQLNLHYSELYRSIPEELHSSQCIGFDRLSETSKKWIRSYFDLYSEEHWLYKEGLIPEEMWSKRIDGGVDVNLITYPTLVDGYEYWKKLGAFRHPPDFIKFVDDKILKLKERISASTKGCSVTKPQTNPSSEATTESAKSGEISPK